MRLLRISDATDKKDAMFILGGVDIRRVCKTLAMAICTQN